MVMWLLDNLTGPVFHVVREQKAMRRIIGCEENGGLMSRDIIRRALMPSYNKGSPFSVYYRELEKSLLLPACGPVGAFPLRWSPKVSAVIYSDRHSSLG